MIDIAKEFSLSRQKLRDAIDGMIVGSIQGNVSKLHSSYVERREAAGGTVLAIDEFWHRLRRRFPGTYWSFADEQIDVEPVTSRHVFVVLGEEDTSLARYIDKRGAFTIEGELAILDAFIAQQDELCGMPHPEDEIEKMMPFDYRGVFVTLRIPVCH